MIRKLPIPLTIALTACTAGSATWSADICACTPAWFNLASNLNLSEVADPQDLTLKSVQVASAKLIGSRASIETLPGTPSGTCKPTETGAICHWPVWANGLVLRGYVAEFTIAPSGTISAVKVTTGTWHSSGGT